MRYTALLFLLAACCPAPQSRATAFRATVTGISPEAQALYVTPEGAAPLTLHVAPGQLLDAQGAPLPLAALPRGAAVYVRGTLLGDDVNVGSVRALAKN